MAQVSAYERPKSLDEALAALSRPSAVVIGGGTKVNAARRSVPITVVDLQALHLDGVQELANGSVRIGATTTLQRLAEDADLPEVIREAAGREQPSTLRAVATLGGCVATAEPSSELLAALLVHDARVSLAALEGVEATSPLADLLDDLASLAKRIITAVTIETGGVSAAARVGRTIADRPIVAAVARRAPSGEIRLALAGVAATPVLAAGATEYHPVGDFRGSSEYRRSLAATLSSRVLEAVA